MYFCQLSFAVIVIVLLVFKLMLFITSFSLFHSFSLFLSHTHSLTLSVPTTLTHSHHHSHSLSLCLSLPGQSNSEHSRHWFFGGKMVIDGEEKKETLFGLVKSTLPAVSNSVIAFHDNSSVRYQSQLIYWCTKHLSLFASVNISTNWHFVLTFSSPIFSFFSHFINISSFFSLLPLVPRGVRSGPSDSRTRRRSISYGT